MSGYIRKRSKDSWEITIDVGKDPVSGKRRQHWETIRGSKREAAKYLAKLLLDRGIRTPTDYRNLTFGSWLEERLPARTRTTLRVSNQLVASSSFWNCADSEPNSFSLNRFTHGAIL